MDINVNTVLIFPDRLVFTTGECEFLVFKAPKKIGTSFELSEASPFPVTLLGIPSFGVRQPHTVVGLCNIPSTNAHKMTKDVNILLHEFLLIATVNYRTAVVL